MRRPSRPTPTPRPPHRPGTAAATGGRRTPRSPSSSRRSARRSCARGTSSSSAPDCATRPTTRSSSRARHAPGQPLPPGHPRLARSSGSTSPSTAPPGHGRDRHPLAGRSPRAPSSTSSCVVPAAELGLSSADTAWGPRGLSVEAVADGRREGIARTFVLWQPTDAPVTPTRVSVLVPLTGGPVDPTETVAEPFLAPDDDDAPATPSDSPSDRTDVGRPLGGRDGRPRRRGERGRRRGRGPGRRRHRILRAGTTADRPGASERRSPRRTTTTLDRLDDVLDATAAQPGVTWAVDPAVVAGRAVLRRERPRAALGRRAQRCRHRPRGRGPACARPGPRGRSPTPTPTGWRPRPGPGPARPPTRCSAERRAPTSPGRRTTSRTSPPSALAARSGATAVVVGGDGLATDRLTYTPFGSRDRADRRRRRRRAGRRPRAHRGARARRRTRRPRPPPSACSPSRP